MPPTRLLVFVALLTLPAAILVGSPGLTAQERSPEVVAEQLAAVYGKQLEQTAYIPALPLIAKLRLSELTGRAEPAAEVGRILAPFLTGERDPVPKSGSEQAGHLIFAAMADRSVAADRDRWIALCRQAADQAFAPDGAALPCMPFQNEMSDAVFMAGPILAATGRLTKEGRSFDAKLRPAVTALAIGNIGKRCGPAAGGHGGDGHATGGCCDAHQNPTRTTRHG